MATQNQCCEYAELIEHFSADGSTLLAQECPVCGRFTLSAAWDRLNDRVDRALSPRRLVAV